MHAQRTVRRSGKLPDHGRSLATCQSLALLRWRSYASAAASADAPVASQLPQVTDPVLWYHDLCRRGKVRRDEAQLRALYQMRPIHEALVDYRPPLHLLTLFDAAQLAPPPSSSPTASSSSSPAKTSRLPPLPKWTTHLAHPEDLALAEQERQDVLQLSNKERDRRLVKVLTEEEELANAPGPPGFLLTGPPGTGKSLLMDIFFDCLPTPFKIRRHYHHFLLSLYSQVLEELERRRLTLDSLSPAAARRDAASSLALSRGWRAVFASGLSPSSAALNSADFVLARVARDLIRDEGWLLAFDEVQLVDVAGAGIVKRVVEWYWRLGGVVIGTSNRVPEHMYDQGVQKQQLASFLRALQLRSPPIDLTSPFDWRRLDRSTPLEDPSSRPLSDGPSWFVVSTDDPTSSARWTSALSKLTSTCGPGRPETLQVYGRPVEIPWAADSPTGRVAKFTYKELCDRPLGPADYISIASNFGSLAVEGVPVFTLTMKNEARRFITFLDAAYECRIKLLVSAAQPIDSTFFPEAASSPAGPDSPSASAGSLIDGQCSDDVVDMSARGSGHPFSPSRIYEGDDHAPTPVATRREGDSLTEESLSEVISDLEAPIRPNVASYRETSTGAAFESEPDLSPRSPIKPTSRAKTSMEHPSTTMTPAFATLSIFTGEDERFAYKRAVSRLHEVTSPAYWRDVEWRPLPRSARTWERGMRAPPPPAPSPQILAEEVGETEEVERGMLSTPGLKPEQIRTRRKDRDTSQELDPFQLDPPKISSVHAWGVVDTWGKKAGRWGQGARAFEGRAQDEGDREESDGRAKKG